MRKSAVAFFGSEKMYWKGLCSVNCELNSILVHEQAFDRLKGEDVSIEGKWLCDEVSWKQVVSL